MSAREDNRPALTLTPAAQQSLIEAGLQVLHRRHPSMRFEFVAGDQANPVHDSATTSLHDDRGQDAA